MTHPSELSAGLEPTVETIELVCDRLADLGLVIGPDTARELVRAILAAEAPRLDARVRDALATSLETIRVATQSAVGLLSTAAPAPAPSAPAPASAAPKAAVPSASAATPVAPSKPAPRAAQPAPPAVPPPPLPSESRRPIARRGPLKDDRDAPPPAPARDLPDDVGARPVFKRPRGR